MSTPAGLATVVAVAELRNLTMKPASVVVAAIAAPLAFALPTELAERQAVQPRVQSPFIFNTLKRLN